ncbi:MAG TPA: alanine racemase, partial [Streptosporangiaceae bacterium]
RVAGVAGYEGSLGPPWQPETLEAVAGFCRRLRGLADALAATIGGGAGRDGEQLIVTAGGSVYYDIVARELTAPGAVPVTVVLRSGCYLTHDHGVYARSSPANRGVAGAPDLRPALELWAQVVSRPEPGLALLGAGRRDVAFDADLPIPLRVLRRDGSRSGVSASDGWQVTDLNDQHAYLHLPEDAALAPGDVVGFGISHPCTTLDKWRVVMVLNDDDRVIDAVHSFF